MRRHHAPLRLIPAFAVLLLAALPGTASASCMMPRPLAVEVGDAQVVMVGTVTSTANDGRWATVTIEEIWKGPDLPATVLVRGGPEPGTFSSVDRVFQLGRYLFLLGTDDQGNLTDNACSSTSSWEPALDAMRPADARAPIPAEPSADGLDLGSLLVPAGVALAVALALLGIGLLARGRQPG